MPVLIGLLLGDLDVEEAVAQAHAGLVLDPEGVLVLVLERGQDREGHLAGLVVHLERVFVGVLLDVEQRVEQRLVPLDG